MAINLRSKVDLYFGDDMWKVDNKVPYKADPTLYHKILSHFEYSMHSIKFQSASDAFVKSGLGTSGASSVALIAGINKAQDLNLTREEIAEKAFEIENELWITGRQDVYASAFGGMNIWEFGNKIKRFEVDRKVAENIKKHLFLYYIGGERKPQISGLTNLDEIKNIATEAITCLNNPRLLGGLLHSSWELKKQSNPNVSNEKIDTIQSEVMKSGAWGFKICGSGGAGYAVIMSDKKPIVNLEEIDYDIDYQGVETRII